MACMRYKVLGLVVAATGVLLGLFWSNRGRAASDTAVAQSVPLHLEGATINAYGDMVKFIDVPAGTGHPGEVNTATFKYFDIECHLSLMPDGNIRVDAATASPSAHVVSGTEHFAPGIYQWANSGYEATVTGPSATIAGRHLWVFRSTNGTSGSWTTGPIEGHPQLSLLPLQKDSVLPGGYSYGSDNRGKLIAVQQAGDQITINWLVPSTDKARPNGYVIDESMVLKMKPPPGPKQN